METTFIDDTFKHLIFHNSANFCWLTDLDSFGKRYEKNVIFDQWLKLCFSFECAS